jgi:hypothetical protein
VSTGPKTLGFAAEPVTLGNLLPRGWLRRQLEIQAAGLSGHLDEFWPDVRDSGWIGGSAEGWERAPYWLDGLVPLAYLLEDERLIGKVERWMSYIVDHQKEDGWLGPEEQERGGLRSQRDPWPLFVLFKAMAQYVDASGNARTLEALARGVDAIDRLLDRHPLFDWGSYRWQDLLVVVLWLYRRNGDAKLLRLAHRLHSQGYNWEDHFRYFQLAEALDHWTFDAHVVNNAMAIKAPALWAWLRDAPDSELRRLAHLPIEVSDRHHGQATGVFSGDECLSGKSPSQGTELCAVVEYLYSLETLLQLVADPLLAERFEQIAYNALPATFSPDMWAHQYDQQVNQAMCLRSDPPVFNTNGPDSNLYGLEPNFGCCTANMHQGFPKFAAHLWMRTPDQGFRANGYAPCEIRDAVGGVPVRIRVEGEYPFEESVRIDVTVDTPVSFPLRLLIPTWAHEAKLAVGGRAAVPVAPGSEVLAESEWSGTTRVELRLPMHVRAAFRYRNAVSVYRGPLLYALEVEDKWNKVGGEEPHADWEVEPSSEWRKALKLDPNDLGRSFRFERRSIGDRPFSPDGSPCLLHARAAEVSSWTEYRKAAAPPPQSPLEIFGDGEGAETDVRLLPYGATNLRIGEIPWYWGTGGD